MDKDLVLRNVKEKIELLLLEFDKYPNSFHYEGDLLARLYFYLSNINEIVEKDTEGDQLLHCQAHLDKHKSFDIVIFDENNTIFIAVECKFDEYSLKYIEKDFEKL